MSEFMTAKCISQHVEIASVYCLREYMIIVYSFCIFSLVLKILSSFFCFALVVTKYFRNRNNANITK